MQDDVGFPVFELTTNEITAVWSGNISSKGNHVWDRLDWHEIHT